MTRIIRAADRATKTQPATNFVGTVYADEVVVGEAPSRMRATRVTFTPGARTNWHSHPVGQVLFCLTGVGRYQLEGDPVHEIRPGDTVIAARSESAGIAIDDAADDDASAILQHHLELRCLVARRIGVPGDGEGLDAGGEGREEMIGHGGGS